MPDPIVTPAPGNVPAATDWAAQGLDADTLGYVQTKGFKTVGDVVTSYRGFEKLQGVPADKLLRLPTDDTPEAWKPIWAKLGAGAAVSDYKLPIPVGDKGEFAAVAASWFHELGVPTSMAAKIAEKFNAHFADSSKKTSEDTKLRLDGEAAALKTKWGAAHDQNTMLAKKAATTFGVDGATLDQLESVMGFGKVMDLFHSIGSKIGEANFVLPDGGGGGNNFSGAMTPDQAKAEIQMLRNDNEFVKKFQAGDAASQARMNKLHQWAYPDNA